MRTGTFYWKTEEYHPDNTFTLNDWLEHYMDELVVITHQSGSYCEVRDEFDIVYMLTASGDGDSYSHKILIQKL